MAWFATIVGIDGCKVLSYNKRHWFSEAMLAKAHISWTRNTWKKVPSALTIRPDERMRSRLKILFGLIAFNSFEFWPGDENMPSTLAMESVTSMAPSNLPRNKSCNMWNELNENCDPVSHDSSEFLRKYIHTTKLGSFLLTPYLLSIVTCCP